MSTVINFPEDEVKRRLVERWVYSEFVKLGKGEAWARKWSRELRGRIRTNPEDMARMRADLRGSAS